MAFPSLFGPPQPVDPSMMPPRVPYRQNPAVTMAGIGLVAGRNLNEGLANLAQTVPAGLLAKSGMQQFMLAQQDRQAKKAEEDARRSQMNEMLKAWPSLSPEQRALAQLYPDQFAQQAFGSMTPPAPTDDMREYAAAQAQGFKGSLQDWMLSQRKAAATQVNVGGTNKYAETVDAGLGKEYLDIQTAGRQALDSKTSLSAMERMMDDPNFYSGTAGEGVLGLKQAIIALGGDPTQAASTEAFNALAKKAALDSMGGSLGTGFSNADRSFVVEQTANLGNTPEGNKAIIQINKKLAERKIEIAKQARAYAAAHEGRIDDGFYDQLSAWAEANPLFTSGGGAAPVPAVSDIPVPDGVDPGVWEYMTPEQKALWK